MRQREAAIGHFRHVFINNAQQVNAVALFAAAAQDLHAQAYAQHRLGTGFDQVDQLAFANLIHRRLRGAHAR